jgi:DNA-binding response OmpR family regulator
MPQPVVLAVDDDSLMLAYLEELLVREGFVFLGAKDAPAALAAMERRRPDLVIVDLGLPGMSGLELCEIMRARDEWAGLPVVIYSGSDELAEPSITDPYDFAFTKDTPPQVLVETIRALVST